MTHGESNSHNKSCICMYSETVVVKERTRAHIVSEARNSKVINTKVMNSEVMNANIMNKLSE